MSGTVDQRVVEMRFDNRNFESNVKTSLGTLEKLKRSLNLKSASKGLENVIAAAKNVNLTPLGAAVDGVRVKFSAMQIAGVTAMVNIANSAVNTGKRMISALTIDPVKTGLQEYETQMNAVQTILANTQSKGSTLNDVNNALDTLNKYADQTIYNFTEMTRNIGTFTAAGVDLQTSVDSIKGIANLAAVSGSSSAQASSAMYQLSQALAAGRVSLMDWNSVVNAGMGGELFQNALIRTSELLKTGAKDAINTYGSFRESLTQGEWLTTEVLTETLKQISGAYTEAELISQGYTKEQAKEIKQLADTAVSAATEVKTFTQLWDVMKESAQSGWSQTWKLIIGDFEEAKALLTPLSDFFTGVIGKMSDARNSLLEGALDLGKPWKSIMDKLNGAGFGKIKKVAETVTDFTDKLEHFQEVVNNVWRGDFGNSDTGRFEKLDAAGYDHRVVQDLVNKGREYKLTVEDIEESHKKFGLTMDKTKSSTEKLTNSLNNLTDKQLKEAGLTEAEIKLYRDLAEEADRTGVSVAELAEEMSKNDGRSLLIDSLKNAGKGLVSVFKAMGSAWRDIFPPMSVARLYNLIKGLNDFSKKLVMSEETVDKLKRTFKGLFAIIDIITTIAGGGLKIAFKFLTQLLGYFNLDILDVTASIGDAIVKFRDWIDNTLDFTKAIEKIAPYLEKAVSAVKDWISSIKDSDVAQNIVDGLVNGLRNGATAVGEAIVALATALVDRIKNFLGIHSPSTVFIWIGAMIIAGLVLGLQNGDSALWDTISGLGTTIVDAFKNGLPAAWETLKNFFGGMKDGVKDSGVLETLGSFFGMIFDTIKKAFSGITSFLGKVDFGALLGTGLIISILYIIKRLTDVLDKFANPLEKFGDMFEGIGNMFSGIGKSFEASAFLKRTEGIYNLAKAIALLAVSFILLASVKWGDIAKGVVVMLTLGVVLSGLAIAVGKMKNNALDFSFSFNAAGFLALAASLLIVAFAVKQLAGIDPETINQGMVSMVGLMIGMGLLIRSLSKIKGGMDKVGGTLIKMSLALLLMVGIAKLIGSMKTEDLVQGTIGILAFVGIISLLQLVTKIGGNKIGGDLIKMVLSIALLVGVAKMIAKMPGEELVKGIAGIAAFTIVIGMLVAAVRLAGGANLTKLGGVVLSISGAMTLLAFTAKILASMSPEDLFKGIGATAALGGIVIGLIAATKLAGSNLKGVALTMIGVSFAIGILAAVTTVLGFMSIEHLAKGIIAVGMLSGMMALLIIATKDAADCKGNLIAMTIAIGIMAAAVIVLSLIDTAKLASATASLAIVMGMFALMTKMAGSLNGVTVKSIVAIGIMTAAVGLMAGMLYMLSKLPVDECLKSAGSLGILMLAMSGSLFIASKMGAVAKQALVSIGLLTLMAVPMLAFVGVLALMQNVQNATNNAILLTAMMAVMTGLLAVLTVIGNFAPLAIAGIVMLTAMAAPMLAFVIVLALIQGIQNATANAELLMDMMTTMTNLLVKVALVAPLAVIGVYALTAMTGLMIGLGAFAVAIGALMTKFPAIEQFLDTGIPIIEKLAYMLGSLVSNLITGFVDNLDLSGLVDIGYQLSAFMTAAQPFIAGAKMVDETVLAGIGILTGAILALTAADVINGITSFLPGAEGFAQLGTQLTQFMQNAWPFLVMATMVDPAAMEGVKALAETIMILTGAKLLEGLTKFISGGVSLADFGAQLGGLASSLKDFATNLGEFDETKLTAVSNATKAIKTLAEAASALPNDGGVWGRIFGENSVSTFGTKLPLLGYNLKTFAAHCAGFDDTTYKSVEYAAKTITALAKAADEIPNEGGIWANIFGDNSLATFVHKLPMTGGYLARFATNLGTFSDDQVSTINCACKAIKAMAEAAQGIDGQAEWAKVLFGDNSLSTFGGEMASFGSSLKSFVSNLGTFGKEQINTVSAAVKAIKALTGLADADLKGAKKNLEGFGEKLGTFGSDLSTFIADLPSEESIDAATTSVSRLINLINNLASAETTDLSGLTDSLKSVGTDGIDAFVKAFSDGTAVAKVSKGAAAMVKALVDGAKAKISSVKTTFTSMVDAGVSAAKGKYQAFYNAGSHLVSGFASGISANSYKAVAKAKAMAEAAEQAARDALDINSPSRVFREIGSGVPEGFAQGVGMLGTVVRSSAENMAKSSIDTVSRSIARLSNIVESDIDAQPTIRPVLDLSDVESGANRIGSLMNMGRTIGVSANVGAISSMMNARSQNGGNHDIVSAIDKLRSDIGNMDRATYSINGVTYDDGSNISDAVQTLVRAAMIERRR